MLQQYTVCFTQKWDLSPEICPQFGLDILENTKKYIQPGEMFAGEQNSLIIKKISVFSKYPYIFEVTELLQSE